jgi:hypothetical protein
VADPVDVLELDPGLTAVHAVDGEAHGGDMAGVDDTLDGLARPVAAVPAGQLVSPDGGGRTFGR